MPQYMRRNILDDEEDDPTLNPLIFNNGYNTDDNQDDDSDTVEPDADSDDDIANDESNSIGSIRPSRFQQIFDSARNIPPGPATSRYQQFLDQGLPEQGKPSKVNRLAAILGGASEGYFRGAGAGVRTARSILDEPRERQLREYERKAKVLEGAAALEDKNLGRAASFARSAANLEANQNTVNQKDRFLQAEVQRWKDNNAVAMENAKNRGITHAIDERGHMMFYRPNGDKFDGGKAGQSISEKTKTAFDLFARQEGIRHSNRISEQENEAGLVQTGQNKTQAAIAAREAAARAGTDERTANNPLTIDRNQRLRMRELIGKYGDKVKDYFHIDENGIPTALKAGDPKDKGYIQLYEYIFGDKK